MNSGFTLLWSKILDSSVWMEDKDTRLVWITMLAMKDWEGKVIASPKALAHRARVEPKECEKALKVLLSPDPDSSSQEFQGRRIKEIQGGWYVLNHEKYRYSTAESQRQRWRENKQRQRKRGTPLAGEQAFEKTGEMPHEYR